MTDRQTCCPHCDTSFRITAQQLQTANGTVRCGSCLRVFNALEHLVTRENEEHTIAAPTTSKSSAIANDNDYSLTLENPETESFQLSPKDTGAPPDKQEENPNKAQRERMESLSELDQELDDMLISDDMDRIEDTQTVSLGSLSESFQPRGSHGDSKGALFDHHYKLIPSDKSLHSADESWAVELLNQLEAEDADSTAKATDAGSDKQEFSELTKDISFVGQFYSDLESTSSHPSNASYIRLPATTETVNASTNSSDSEQQNTREETLTPTIEGTNEPSAGPDQSPRPDKEKLLHAIPNAPVEMEWRSQRSPLRGRLLWGTLCLLAALLLCIQYAWFNINRLGLVHPWRQVYLQLCPHLGCQTPTLVAPEKIKASNLLVRTHPKIEQALIIDSVLLNTARFSQPFPDFHLAFSDIKGRLIAERRFTPQEYLKGELAGMNSMPSEQPVHISLEIVDPGKAAVNYTASVPLD